MFCIRCLFCKSNSSRETSAGCTKGPRSRSAVTLLETSATPVRNCAIVAGAVAPVVLGVTSAYPFANLVGYGLT